MTPSKWQGKWLRNLNQHHDGLKRAAMAAESFCGRFVRNERDSSVLVLAGHTGCGKTHIAECIYNYCDRAAFQAYCGDFGKGWKRHWNTPTVHFVRWPAIVRAIAAKNEEQIDDLFRFECVVIDDIGADTDSFKVGADRLCQVLSRRERMFTVITTNIPSDQWGQQFDARISDRLLRNSVVVEMNDVPSYAVWKLCQ